MSIFWSSPSLPPIWADKPSMATVRPRPGCMFWADMSNLQGNGKREKMIGEICGKPEQRPALNSKSSAEKLGYESTVSESGALLCCQLLWRLPEESLSYEWKSQPPSRSSINLKWLFGSNLWLLHHKYTTSDEDGPKNHFNSPHLLLVFNSHLQTSANGLLASGTQTCHSSHKKI